MEKMEIEKELEKFGLSKESYLAACKDIDAKLEGKLDIDWCERKDKYNIQCSADTIRKASTTIFGGHYRKKLEDTPENNKMKRLQNCVKSALNYRQLIWKIQD